MSFLTVLLFLHFVLVLSYPQRKLCLSIQTFIFLFNCSWGILEENSSSFTKILLFFQFACWGFQRKIRLILPNFYSCLVRSFGYFEETLSYSTKLLFLLLVCSLGFCREKFILLYQTSNLFFILFALCRWAGDLLLEHADRPQKRAKEGAKKKS